MIRWFCTGLSRLLAHEPWSERRKRQRRALLERRQARAAVPIDADRRERPADRREGDRRGRGWLRFWNPS